MPDLTPSYEQKLILLRETLKVIGTLLVVTGTITSEQAGLLLSSGLMIGGGCLTIAPIIWQLYNAMRLNRIASIAKLPCIKAIITDHETAAAIPLDKVVASTQEIK